MAENKYWFARRFPLGDRRNAMSPITSEGHRVAWIFVAWMIGGAIAAGVVAVAVIVATAAGDDPIQLKKP